MPESVMTTEDFFVVVADSDEDVVSIACRL